VLIALTLGRLRLTNIGARHATASVETRRPHRGGALAIASAAEEGTIVSARLPVRRLDAAPVLESLAH
jgi:hypothetical protein